MKEWYKIKGQHLKNIADKIRLYLGITDEIMPDDMDNKVTNVYEAGEYVGREQGIAEGYESGREQGFGEGYETGRREGEEFAWPLGIERGKQVEYDSTWDKIQQNGNRVNYTYGFGGYTWNNETFKPKYDMKPTDALGMFILCQIKDLRKSAIGVDIDFSESARLTNLLNYATVKYVGVIDTRKCSGSSSIASMFASSGIVYVEKLILKNDGSQGSLSGIFQTCPHLEHVIIEGTIGQTGFNVSSCTKLDIESLLSILNALANKSGDTSGTSWVCTLGATNLAKLTAEQKQIATDKGWTLA